VGANKWLIFDRTPTDEELARDTTVECAAERFQCPNGCDDGLPTTTIDKSAR
jgi:hypothetical protein